MIRNQPVDYSIRKPSKEIWKELRRSFRNIQSGYGSIEIIIQDWHIVQISERVIKKTNNQAQNNIKQ